MFSILQRAARASRLPAAWIGDGGFDRGGVRDPVRAFEQQADRAATVHGCTDRSSSARRLTASEWSRM